MRDIALVMILLGLIPVIFRYPWIGALAYAWVSIFVPHRWTFGFANDMPIAMIVAVTTLASMLLHPKQVGLPINRITVLLMLLPIWMTVTAPARPSATPSSRAFLRSQIGRAHV